MCIRDRDKETSLNRYNKFCQLVSKGKHEVNLASLPPTTEAAHQHILRVFHQVQLWYGNVLDPEKWGWQKQHGNSLVPVTTLKPPAPENLLKLVVCRCIKGCHSGCGCVKAGLRCTLACSHCKGISCQNSPQPVAEEEEENLEEDYDEDLNQPEDATAKDYTKEDEGVSAIEMTSHFDRPSTSIVTRKILF